MFVAATIALFASGVVMLVNGDGEGAIRGLHVASFWVWIACLAVHVALNGREVLRLMRTEWLTRARASIAGAELRALLVLSSILGGVMVALALISKITGYEMGDQRTAAVASPWRRLPAEERLLVIAEVDDEPRGPTAHVSTPWVP